MTPPSEELGVVKSRRCFRSTNPWTISDFDADPPATCSLLTRTRSRSSPPCSSESTLAASIAISVIRFASPTSIFPARVVSMTPLSCKSFGLIEILSSSDRDSSTEIRYPFIIKEGWTPILVNSNAFRSNSAIRRTEVVVPSLATLSWAELVAINRLAVGCSTLAVSRTVIPSFVTIISPLPPTNILSEPRGPNVERTAPARANAALTLLTRAERPSIRSVSCRATSCSDSTMLTANQAPDLNAM